MRLTVAFLFLALCSAYADSKVVQPSNVDRRENARAIDDLNAAASQAQHKYDADMAKEDARVEQARQFKILQEQQLQQMLATRRDANTMPVVPTVRADIEKLVHGIDPELVIVPATNHGVIRYKVQLKDWDQHTAIYSALAGVQKLGMNGVKDPPSVTISIDERSLPPAEPTPELRVAETPPEPPVAMVIPRRIPTSNSIPFIAALAGLVSLSGVLGVWFLVRRRQA